MLRLRVMQPADIPFAVRLTNQESWDIPARDFQRILRLDARGSFIATSGTQKVGLATTTRYGREISWIGNVVVRKQLRHKHIGQYLVEHAIKYLYEKRVKHIALYSFRENFKFYEKLGFLRGQSFLRLRCEGHQSSTRTRAEPPVKPLTLSSMLAMDREAFGADRRRLLKLLLGSGNAWFRGFTSGSGSAYILVKRYEEMHEIGPWISFGEQRLLIESLLDNALNEAGGKPVEASCPTANPKVIRALKRRRFRVINKGRLMFHEHEAKFGRPEAILAYGFLDKG